MTPVLLAAGWGVVVAAVLFALIGQVRTSSRARSLRPRDRSRPLLGTRICSPRQMRVPRSGRLVVVRVVQGLVRGVRARRVNEAVTRDLPVAVDLAGVAVGAGCTPWQAIALTADFGPPTVAAPLERARRATELGLAFDDALRDAGAAVSAVAPLTDALRTGVQTGAPIGPVLARVAHEVRADTRRRAEARARRAPVRLLFPLVLCILPAFVLLTVAPVVLDGFQFS